MNIRDDHQITMHELLLTTTSILIILFIAFNMLQEIGEADAALKEECDLKHGEGNWVLKKTCIERDWLPDECDVYICILKNESEGLAI